MEKKKIKVKCIICGNEYQAIKQGDYYVKTCSPNCKKSREAQFAFAFGAKNRGKPGKFYGNTHNGRMYHFQANDKKKNKN